MAVNKKILITGGAGIIGVNSANAFAKSGWRVCILDNLSRKGAQLNLDWLMERVEIEFKQVDIRNADEVSSVFKNYQPDVVLHLAAQVAVTTSVVNPREDFEINAAGTLNVLEALRLECPETFFIRWIFIPRTDAPKAWQINILLITRGYTALKQ
jgi:CDP-paratose 2-epimerase